MISILSLPSQKSPDMPDCRFVKCLMIALAVFAAMVCAGVRAQAVASPGGETSFDFALEDGVPKAKVWRAGRVACEMTLGIVSEKYELVSVATQRIDRTWQPVWGVQAECAGGGRGLPDGGDEGGEHVLWRHPLERRQLDFRGVGEHVGAGHGLSLLCGHGREGG